MNVDMNPVINRSPIISNLRYVEWSFATIHLLINASRGRFNNTLLETVLILAFVGALILLSLVFPAARPYWQKQGYVSLGILLVVSANLVGIGLDLFVFVYIAKSCFLLHRKSILPTTIITGIAWVFSEIWDLTHAVYPEQIINLEPPYGVAPSSLAQIVVFPLGVYTAGSIFVIFFSLVIMAEQKSRQQAEALTSQVEALTVTLERTRIARDIHDSLGHTLTDLNIQLEVAQKMRDRDPNTALEALNVAKLLASQCIEDVSHALQAIREKGFDLDYALSGLIEQASQRESLQIHWHIDLPDLPMHRSYQVYCIFKEGLMNIQKHAHASYARFQGRLTPKGIVLELEDNGVGFDPEVCNSGFGLKGMAERVQILGGNFKITSAQGQGTHIQVTIPL